MVDYCHVKIPYTQLQKFPYMLYGKVCFRLLTDFFRNGVNYSHVLLLYAPLYRLPIIPKIFLETNWVNTRIFVSLLWTISGGTGDGKYMGGETFNEIVIFVMKKICYEFCYKKKSYAACAARLFSL